MDKRDINFSGLLNISIAEKIQDPILLVEAPNVKPHTPLINTRCIHNNLNPTPQKNLTQILKNPAQAAGLWALGTLPEP